VRYVGTEPFCAIHLRVATTLRAAPILLACAAVSRFWLALTSALLQVMITTSCITATVILALVFSLVWANGDSILMPALPIDDLYTGRYTAEQWWLSRPGDASTGRR
jgi:hypothetical protein